MLKALLENSLSHQSLENFPKILRYLILHSFAGRKYQALINFLPILIHIIILVISIFVLIFSLEYVLVHSNLPFYIFIPVLLGIIFLLRVLTIFATQFHQSLWIEQFGNMSQFLHISLMFLLHSFNIVLITIF